MLGGEIGHVEVVGLCGELGGQRVDLLHEGSQTQLQATPTHHEPTDLPVREAADLQPLLSLSLCF